MFWIVTLLFAYAVLGLFGWWAWVAYFGTGLGLATLWWTRRRRNRCALVFGFCCAVVAVMALLMTGWALFVTVSAPVDSVGTRGVVCGSVVSPVSAEELNVTVVRSEEPVSQSRPIPHSELERVCSNRLDARGSRAAGLALIGLFVALRAAGHIVPPRRASAA
ncbi:hypothetical protein [Rhodococcus rhodnii]|uniref:hypothetical protein n=1 Tax=Rhodococcus rhodnii TaxID=38312 RepID=UPI0011600F9D|nr:hypothetical protein [Rhodococcus rhodnii]